MLSGNKAPTIKLTASSGPKLSIGNIKTLNKQNPKVDKNGNPIKNNDAETTNDDRLKAEKNGSETSVDNKVKKILKNLQKTKDTNEQNTDPNAPINSEKDPSRFDQANLKNGNSAKDSAERFGFSMPGTSKGSSDAQKANNAQAQAGGAAGSIGGIASSSGAGGFGSGGGSQQQGGNNNPWTGGGATLPPNNGGGGSPGTGGGTPTHEHSFAHAKAEFGATAFRAESHDDHDGYVMDAPTGQLSAIQEHWQGYDVAEVSPGKYEIDMPHDDEINNLDSINNLDVNTVASLDAEETNIQPEQEIEIPEPEVQEQVQEVA